MDRFDFHPPFEEGKLPNWRCSSSGCARGRLQLVQDSWQEAESAETKTCSSEDWFEEEHYLARFSARLACSFCADPVFIVGRKRLFRWEDWEEQTQGVNVELWPTFVEPAPEIIEVPTGCPSETVEALHEAFSVYWASPNSAANQTRIAVERLLDAQQIPSTRKSAAGKETFIPLDQRIDEFSKRLPDVANLLRAVKWIGNNGSHGDPVKHKDVLDGLEFVEHALRDLYPEARARIMERAREINSNKGLGRRR